MSKVLLVEDDAWLGDCLSDWLRADGHEVWRASDAQAALQTFDTITPDVIVLDLLLPAANGIQVLHMLPSYADVAEVPVIVCSSALPPDLPDLAAYGVRAALDKSTLTPRFFRETVNKVVTHATV